MTIGTIYAINRLKKAKIFCISPPRVNVRPIVTQATVEALSFHLFRRCFRNMSLC